MKYLTKEWYQMMQHSDLHLDLKASHKAQTFSEAYFRDLYQIKEAAWLKEQEEIAGLGFEDLNPLEFPADQIFPDLLVLPAEHRAAEAEYLTWRAEEEKTFVPPAPFDANEERKRFRAFYRETKKTLEKELPKEILDQAADIRVLALGVATPEVKQAIRAFCKGNQRAVDSAVKAYWRQYRHHFKKGEPAFAEQFAFHDCTVLSCRRDNEDLVLTLDNSGGFTDLTTIRFQHAAVLHKDRPLAGAWWLYEEIYPAANGYEIHVLLQKRGLIDFIVQASDAELT